MKLRTSLLSSALAVGVVAGSPALAQDWYVQGFLGYSFEENFTPSGNIGGAPQSVFNDLSDGFNIGASVGRNFSLSNGINLRGEIELSYGENDVDAVNFSGNGPGFENAVSGDIEATFLLANLLVDFETGGPLTPYVGAGIGVGFIDQNINYNNAVNISGDDEAFAAQLIAGASYKVNDTTSIFGDVRFIRAYDVSGTRTAPGGVASVSDDLDRTTLNVGVRFNF